MHTILLSIQMPTSILDSNAFGLAMIVIFYFFATPPRLQRTAGDTLRVLFYKKCILAPLLGLP